MKSLAFAALALLACAIPAAAQRFDAGSALGPERDSADYSIRAEPGGGGSPSVVSQQARAAYAVTSGSGTWSVHARAGELALGRVPVVIPQSGVVVPTKLWNAQAGAGYSERLGDRRRWGATFSVGSASDSLFHSRREDDLSVTADAELPSGERNSWLLFLNYSTNRVFLNGVPLPGAAYVLRRDRFELTAGFPFLSARWWPNDDWTASASVFGGATWSLEAERKVSRAVRLYARLERTPQQWMRVGRADSKDRLVFDQKAARLGARLRLGGGWTADLSGGRAFDRRVFEGRDAQHSSGARAALSNCWVMAAQLAARF